MLILLVFICLAAAVFFALYGLLNAVKLKKEEKKKSGIAAESAPSVNFSNPKTKKIMIALIIFLAVAVVLQNIIFGIIACGLYVYFSWQIKKSKEKKLAALIDKQVIEALTVIKNAVQSGQSLQNAINTACDELKEPIKPEFVKMSEKLALGVSFDKVLTDAAANSPSKEFRLMIDTIRISKDSGASLAGIFDRIIDATTQRVTIQAKVEALTAQGRLSGNVVSVIPFFVVAMMYTIEPDMISSLFTTFIGNVLLLVVVIMVLTGSFAIRKLTEIDF
ncbi:MAG: type II secretion system F family protein [Endomicrobia bacterium]|nr:type II secretion system F family protein [Endomicrobiia bacterium]